MYWHDSDFHSKLEPKILLKIKKIAIIGNTASGKSSLSILLGEMLEITIFHLDKYLWRPGWERVPEDEYTASHNRIVEKDSWILDGVGYFSTMEKRLAHADLILYFDLEPDVCKKRAMKRMQEEKFRPNPFTNDCPYTETPENVIAQNKVIEYFHNEYKVKLDSLLQRLEDTKAIIYIRDEIETDELFLKIKQEIDEIQNT